MIMDNKDLIAELEKTASELEAQANDYEEKIASSDPSTYTEFLSSVVKELGL